MLQLNTGSQQLKLLLRSVTHYLQIFSGDVRKTHDLPPFVVCPDT